jgi:hypothetical protein
MDTDKKKCKADLEAHQKRLKSEAQIKKQAYQERRAEEAQLAKVNGFPMGFQYSAGSAETMDAVGGDVTMEEHAESEEDYKYARVAKELAAERVKLDKLTMEFNQEMQRGASCYA